MGEKMGGAVPRRQRITIEELVDDLRLTVRRGDPSWVQCECTCHEALRDRVKEALTLIAGLPLGQHRILLPVFNERKRPLRGADCKYEYCSCECHAGSVYPTLPVRGRGRPKGSKDKKPRRRATAEGTYLPETRVPRKYVKGSSGER